MQLVELGCIPVQRVKSQELGWYPRIKKATIETWDGIPV
jgi:hypothetical protein